MVKNNLKRGITETNVIMSLFGNILQDGGAKLCVVDESNEHELFVYDTEKGRKLASTKVS